MDKQTAKAFLEDNVELKEALNTKNENRMQGLEILKRFLSVDRLINEIVLNGLSVNEMKDTLQYILRQNDTGPRIADLREQLRDLRGRRELSQLVNDQIIPLFGEENLLDEFVRAMSNTDFRTVAQDIARVHDLPRDVRNHFER